MPGPMQLRLTRMMFSLSLLPFDLCCSTHTASTALCTAGRWERKSVPLMAPKAVNTIRSLRLYSRFSLSPEKGY